MKSKRKYMTYTTDLHQLGYIQRESLAINGQKEILSA